LVKGKKYDVSRLLEAQFLVKRVKNNPGGIFSAMALIMTGETVPNSMAVELVTLTVTNFVERLLSRK